MLAKNPPIVSKKLREACRGEDLKCVRCNRVTGNVCGRHLTGFRQHMLGKGKGVKCHDIAMAQLCNDCDAELSEGQVDKNDWDSRVEHSEEFLFYCMLTLVERVRDETIKI